VSFNYEYTIGLRDTDAAGVAYFASIVSIFHIAYEASLIASGINLRSLINNSEVAVPIGSVTANFLRPLFCGDRITIALTPQAIDISTFEIQYQILAKSKLMATATTKHIVIDRQTRKRQALPADLDRWLTQWSKP
jgi:1,4-dihydroxy-2-naphthoyl-CoA hydrolase